MFNINWYHQNTKVPRKIIKENWYKCDSCTFQANIYIGASFMDVYKYIYCVYLNYLLKYKINRAAFSIYFFRSYNLPYVWFSCKIIYKFKSYKHFKSCPAKVCVLHPICCPLIAQICRFIAQKVCII